MKILNGEHMDISISIDPLVIAMMCITVIVVNAIIHLRKGATNE